MKNLLLFVFLIIGTIAMAQDQVITHAQKKSVVLEEFTGIHCVFCPDGHRIAKEIKAANPGRVSLVNVHAGGYANPSEGEPDFRTPGGSTLDGSIGVNGYPSGTVNRTSFDGENNYSRSLWSNYSNQILDQASRVNVAAKTTYDEATRTLTVMIEAYYTISAEESTNRLIIALTQDHVEGPQTGATNFNPGDILPNGKYEHGHMLRAFLTGPFGSAINATTGGTYYTDTVEYIMPLEIRGIPLISDDCTVTVYVSEGQESIHTGVTLGLNDANNGETESVSIVSEAITPIVVNTTAGDDASFSSTFYPYLQGEGMYNVTVSSDDAPSDWSWTYTINGIDYIENATVTLNEAEAQDFAFNVNSNAGGVGNYTIEISPIAFTPEKVTYNVAVVHDCADLVISSEGESKNGFTQIATEWSNLYLNAFEDAGLSNYGALTETHFKALDKAKKLDGISNVYYNSGWTSEVLDNALTSSFLKFAQKGGNIFMCGQDLATEVYSTGAPLAQNLVRTFMGTSVDADGSPANNSAEFVADGIFNNMSALTFRNYYGVNTILSDELTPSGSGVACLNYRGGSKVAAINKESSSYKSVFLGFGLEMVSTAEMRSELIHKVYNFFYGISGTDKITYQAAGLDIYPNPTVDKHVWMFNTKVNDVKVEILDLQGRNIKSINIEPTIYTHIDLTDYPAGVYIIKHKEGNGFKSTKLILR